MRKNYKEKSNAHRKNFKQERGTNVFFQFLQSTKGKSRVDIDKSWNQSDLDFDHDKYVICIFKNKTIANVISHFEVVSSIAIGR